MKFSLKDKLCIEISKVLDSGIPKILSLLILFTFAVVNVQGTMIVDWGGDYVDGSRNLILPASVDNDGTRTFPFSDLTPLTPGTNLYSAPEGKSGAFYGALESTCDDGTPRDFAAHRISNIGDDDNIYIQGVSSVAGTLRGLFFFPKAGYLNGYEAKTVSLLGVKGKLNLMTLGDSGSIRLAVCDSNNQWYVSQTERTSTGWLEINSLDGEAWGKWDPSGSPIDPLPVSYNIAGSAINDVIAFGYYFTASRGHSTFSITLQNFQIERQETGTVFMLH